VTHGPEDLRTIDLRRFGGRAVSIRDKDVIYGSAGGIECWTQLQERDSVPEKASKMACRGQPKPVEFKPPELGPFISMASRMDRAALTHQRRAASPNWHRRE